MSITINDAPLEALGLRLLRGTPRLGTLTRQYAHAAWTGRAGGVGSSLGTTPPEVITLGVNIPKGAGVAARQARYTQLVHLLSGPVELRDSAAPECVMRARARVIAPSVPSPTFVNDEADVQLELVADAAMRYDDEPITVSVGATPVPVWVGTLHHAGWCRIMGAAAGALSTAVTIRGRTFAGHEIGAVTITPTLAAGESMLYSLETGSLHHVSTANAITARPEWLTGGTPFSFGPCDAVSAQNAWPTIESTAGSMLYTYRRTYLP